MTAMMKMTWTAAVGYLLSVISIILWLRTAHILPLTSSLQGLLIALTPALGAYLVTLADSRGTRNAWLIRLLGVYYALLVLIPLAQKLIDNSGPNASESRGFAFALTVTGPWALFNVGLFLVLLVLVIVKTFFGRNKNISVQ
jgi:hypothetical protein